MKTHLKTQIPIQETKNTTLKVPYAGTYGAKYKFTLSTNEETHVSAVTEYQIAPCPPPHQVIVYQHNNGYAVTWDVKSGSSTLSSKKLVLTWSLKVVGLGMTVISLKFLGTSLKY